MVVMRAIGRGQGNLAYFSKAHSELRGWTLCSFELFARPILKPSSSRKRALMYFKLIGWSVFDHLHREIDNNWKNTENEDDRHIVENQ